MQVVMLIWTDGYLKIPLGVRLWQKGGKSKVALAVELLAEAKVRALAPEYVLFDSWYAASQLLHLLAQWRWKYVARLRSNRNLDGRQVRQQWRHRYGQRVGCLSRVRHTVRVVKDGRRYWVTNDLELTPKEVKLHYRFRQQIEEVFRLLKQEFGFAGSSVRTAQGQVAHLHMALIGLCVVQRAAYQSGDTIYELKRELLRAPIPQHLSLLDEFMAAA